MDKIRQVKMNMTGMNKQKWMKEKDVLGERIPQPTNHREYLLWNAGFNKGYEQAEKNISRVKMKKMV
jgi:hypothetical protein